MEFMIRHDSIRGWFFYEFYQQMKKNNKMIAITADLGYGGFDAIRDEMPDQFLNVGASEFTGCCVAVGLACQGFIPFYYSITPFLLYRSFEVIRNYINREQIPVKLIGSGRDKDYKVDGWSHDASDAKQVMDIFKNIKCYWPEKKEEIPQIVEEMIINDKPCFLSLRR